MTTIVSTPDVLHGEPRIEGRRISVRQIGDMVELEDRSPRSVAHAFELDITDVYRALIYYHEHSDEIAKLRGERSQIESDMKGESITGPEDLPQPEKEA